MSKKKYKENISVSTVTNEPQLNLRDVPKDTKVNILGYELCNGAEWQDFLEVLNKLGEENHQLKQQLEKKEKENKRIKKQIKEKEKYIVRLLEYKINSRKIF